MADNDKIDPVLMALRASTDQYGAGLRDLAAAHPELAELARAMAQMIREQCPGADGSAVIAAAQAANGAVALIAEQGGHLEVQGAINLVFLAGRALAEGEVQT